MEVVAARAITVGGKSYRAGESVKADLSPEKLAQMVAQRLLLDKTEGSREYVALRPFTVGGKTYARGERLKVKKLSANKLSQLLEHRYLDPAPV